MFHYSGKDEKSNHETDNCKKPDGLLTELADAVIRILDFIGSINEGERFEQIIKIKHEFNKTRPIRHGNKAL